LIGDLKNSFKYCCFSSTNNLVAQTYVYMCVCVCVCVFMLTIPVTAKQSPDPSEILLICLFTAQEFLLLIPLLKTAFVAPNQHFTMISQGSNDT